LFYHAEEELMDELFWWPQLCRMKQNKSTTPSL
jgi:hypothetical protein